MPRIILSFMIVGLFVSFYAGAQPTVDPEAPLSSMVAVRLTAGGYPHVPAYVKFLVDRKAQGEFEPRCSVEGIEFPCPPGVQVPFPLENTTTDTVRTIPGLAHNVVISWLDPLTQDESIDAPRFGVNNDYIAYFGDGWNSDWNIDVLGSPPQFNGSGASGWIWSNHEYLSNNQPTPTSAPTGQHLTLAKFLQSGGVLTNDVESNVWSQADVDTYIQWFKKQVGGTWMHVFQEATTGEWKVDRNARNVRYDSTDNTILKIQGYTLTEDDHDDTGNTLLPDLGVGVAGDCSGGQTPWGTVISAEENVQDYYGDLEATWTSVKKFLTGNGFDPGANIDPNVMPSQSGQYGQTSDPNQRHNRDVYGFLVEMDPGQDPDFYYISAAARQGDGHGHRKLGVMGRARWENATVRVDSSFKLPPNQPVVIYGANDRRSGRIYKWVSNAPYAPDMTRAEVRALLDAGKLYVSHFADLDNRTGFTLFDPNDANCNTDPGGDNPEATIAAICPVPTEEAPGTGQWILMSVDNTTQTAPNAASLGAAGTSVGMALRDVNWNGIGGFPSDNDVKKALFTAATKLGVMELNRPEDVEWNPNYSNGPVLHVAFTKMKEQVALDQNGVLFDPNEHDDLSPTRVENVGSIFTLREESDPATSTTFTFWLSWRGTRGAGPYDAGNPDNLMVDKDGGLWFGTDGNFGLNGTADAVYYLDLDPAHKEGRVPHPTYGKPFRVAAGPSDSEATGPALNSTMTTVFFNVQHPGEGVPDEISTWPQEGRTISVTQ